MESQWTSGPAIGPPGVRSFSPPGLPAWHLAYLRLLTDSVGVRRNVYNGWIGSTGGYSTEDNARALVVSLWAYRQTHRANELNLAYRYLNFLIAAQTEQGPFRDGMDAGQSWLAELGSPICQGRAIWALCTAVAQAPEPALRLLAQESLGAIRPAMHCLLESLPAAAIALVGVSELGQTEPDWQPEIDRLAVRLCKNGNDGGNPARSSVDPAMTVEPARLPQALLRAHQATGSPDYQQAGLAALDFVIDEFDRPGAGHGHGHGTSKGFVHQHSVDVAALVEACLDAARITGRRYYRGQAARAYRWFLGRNPWRQALLDLRTGACCGRLLPDGSISQPSAAETLAHLQARLALAAARLDR